MKAITQKSHRNQIDIKYNSNINQRNQPEITTKSNKHQIELIQKSIRNYIEIQDESKRNIRIKQNAKIIKTEMYE